MLDEKIVTRKREFEERLLNVYFEDIKDLIQYMSIKELVSINLISKDIYKTTKKEIKSRRLR